MQNTHSHTELDTVPPQPAWKCPLGKFRSSILHGAYQMHRFTRCIGIQPDISSWQNGAVQFAVADLSDETQSVKCSHVPRTDFELCILDMFNLLSVPSTCAISGASTSTSWTCSRCVPSSRHREKHR